MATLSRDARELARRIGTMAPGTTVKLGLIHQGEEKTVDAYARHAAEREVRPPTSKPTTRAPDSDVPKLGLTLAPEQGRPARTATAWS